MTKAEHVIEAIIIAPAALPLVAGIWKHIDHPKGALSCAKEKPAPARRHNIRIDHIDIVHGSDRIIRAVMDCGSPGR